LGLPPDLQLEFVNGGHGIKNPLAVENAHGGHHRIRNIDCIDDLSKHGHHSQQQQRLLRRLLLLLRLPPPPLICSDR